MRLTLSVLISFMSLLTVACDNSDDKNATGELPPAPAYTWNNTGLKLTSTSFELRSTDSRGLIIIQDENGAVSAYLIATPTGLWRLDLSADADWQKTGPAGFKPESLLQVAESKRLIAAGRFDSGIMTPSIQYSDDLGKTWHPSTDVPVDPVANRYIEVTSLVSSPADSNLIYADGGGGVLIISTDGGVTWSYQNGVSEPGFGLHCHIAIPAWSVDTLYQGCEAPLDLAWIDRYSINPQDPSLLENRERVIDSYSEGIPVLENRRPNSLRTFPNENGILYAGVEGMLIRVDVESKNNFKSLYDQSNHGLYVYVTHIAKSGSRIVFGGFDKGPAMEFSLFSSNHNGESILRIQLPTSLDGGTTRIGGLAFVAPETLAVMLERHPPSSTDGVIEILVWELELQPS